MAVGDSNGQFPEVVHAKFVVGSDGTLQKTIDALCLLSLTHDQVLIRGSENRLE